MQPIISTGFSLAILIAVPALAFLAPASLAQTSRQPATETSDQTDTSSVTARPTSFIQRITAAKQSEERWRQAVEENPKDAATYRNLADALTALSRYRDAEAIYQRAIQLDLADEASYLALGTFLQKRTRPYDAAILYQQMVEAVPESAIAHEQFADSLTRVAAEDWPNLNAEIEAAYRRAILLDPDQTTAYYGLSDYLVSQDRFAEATAVLRETLRFAPNDSRIYTALAAIPIRRDNPIAAAAIYQEGLAAQPENSDLYLSFASWLSDNSRSAEAKALYQAAIEQGITEEPTAYVQLGDLLISEGRSAEAKAVYEQAILLSPDAYTYGALGQLLESTEGDAAAIALYQRAINKPRIEDKGYFYRQIGRLQRASGQIDEAIATYRQALRVTDSPDIAIPLAELFLSQQQFDEALSLYKRFKFSFDSDRNILENWRTALRGSGKAAEADTLLQDFQTQLAAHNAATYLKAIAITPESGHFYDLLGDALSQQGKTADADAAYQEALRLNYGVFSTRIKLGKSLFEQGELVEAETVYQQALDLTPRHDRQYFISDQSQLYQGLGELYKVTNRPVLALEFYQKALEIDPDETLIKDRVVELSAKVLNSGTTTRSSIEAEAGGAINRSRD